MTNLIAFCLLISMSSICAQTTSKKVIGIQAKYSYANSLHYNAPVAVVSYIEGTNYFRQYPRSRSQYELALLKSISANQDIKIGIGLSSYSFFQEREDVWVIGLPSYPIIKTEFNYRFLSYIIGIRHKFKSETNVRPYIDFEFQYDQNIIKDFSVKQGAALKLATGIMVEMNDRTQIITDIFYKSALTAYNWQKTYYPFQWGIALGLVFRY